MEKKQTSSKKSTLVKSVCSIFYFNIFLTHLCNCLFSVCVCGFFFSQDVSIISKIALKLAYG